MEPVKLHKFGNRERNRSEKEMREVNLQVGI